MSLKGCLRGLSILLLLLVAGCATSAQIRYYLLTAEEQGEPVPAQQHAPLRLEIASVEIPAYLDRQQIVSLNRNHQLEIAEFDQWGGQLKGNIARVVADNLLQLMPDTQVTLAPHPSGFSPDYQLHLAIHAFELAGDNRVQLSVSWSIADSASRLLRQQHRRLYSTPISRQDYTARVRAMSQLLDRLSQMIRDDFHHLIQEKQAPESSAVDASDKTQ